MKIVYQPTFLRTLRSLPKSIQEMIVKKMRLFENQENHKALRVHKLHGRLQGRYSFSVNPVIRVIFCYSQTKPKEAHILTVGTHEVYDV